MSAGNDPVQVAPHVYSVLLENDRVRVLDVRRRPGEKSARHRQPDSVWYLVSPMRARFTADDGSTAEAEFPAGAVSREAETYAVEHLGTREVRAVAVELK